MMQNERDRQYQEDMLILAGNIGEVAHAIIQNKQKPVDGDEQELTQTVEGTGDETLQQKGAVASTGSEYEDNGHGALRYVQLFNYLIICFKLLFPSPVNKYVYKHKMLKKSKYNIN